MAFVTYILLAALYSGVQERFHPEILGRVASRALVVVLLEFGFIKLGCYLLNISGSSQVTDLFAYSGYKFVGFVLLYNQRVLLLLTMFVNSVVATVLFAFTRASSTIYLGVFLYAFGSNGFFLVRIFRFLI